VEDPEGEPVVRGAPADSSLSARGLVAGSARSSARLLRAVLTFGLWLALGFGVCLTAAIALPTLVGYRALTVVSGSMEPTIETGSIVLDKVISPLEAKPGEVVTFPDPSRAGRLVTHRLRSMRVDGATAHMVTKGDANDAVERWTAPVDGRIGRVVYHVPKLGYARALISTRVLRLALLAAVLALGALLLLDVWCPRRGHDVPHA
jgi:signal peptidase I